MKTSWWPTYVLVLSLVSACADALPTSDDGGLIPLDVETVELRIPLSTFTSGVEVFSGFGSTSDLPTAVVAHEWGGALESRMLLRFGSLPEFVTVRIPESGGFQVDSTYATASGLLAIQIDTMEVLGTTAFEADLGAVETEWDAGTATWALATDTLGGSVAWPEPGGGPVRFLDRAFWTPIVGDSGTIDTLTFAVDSSTIKEWTDTTRLDVGGRIEGVTSASRFRIVGVDLVAFARSEIDPDTLIEISAEGGEFASIYDPSPPTEEGILQIGGAPASRAVFPFDLGEVLDAAGELCTSIECPLGLDSDRLVYAALVLHPRPSASPGFDPVDTLFVELREVLSPDRLPRSPLGFPLQDGSGGLAPERFAPGASTPYEIPITTYLRSLIDADPLSSIDSSPTLALLTSPEPTALEVVSFHAPGTPLEPYLRLVWTVSDEISLP